MIVVPLAVIFVVWVAAPTSVTGKHRLYRIIHFGSPTQLFLNHRPSRSKCLKNHSMYASTRIKVGLPAIRFQFNCKIFENQLLDRGCSIPGLTFNLYSIMKYFQGNDN